MTVKLKKKDSNGNNWTIAPDFYKPCIASIWGEGKCLRQTLEYEKMGFAKLATDGRLLLANDVLCQMLGYTESELKQFGLDSLIHPDDLDTRNGIVLWTETGSVSYEECEKRYRCVDGSYLWFRKSQSLITSHTGEPVYYVIQMENISRQKQVEESLAKKEVEFRLFVENSPDLISHYDLEGRYIYVNRQFEKLAGRTSADLLGHRVDEVLWPGTKDGNLLNKEVMKVISDKEALETEIAYLNTDEETQYILLRVLPELNADGKLNGVLAFGTDITKQKRREEELLQNKQLLQSVLDNIPQATFWKDRNMTFVGCNQAFADEAHLASPAEIIGKTDYDMPWISRADSYRKDDQLILSGLSKINYEEQRSTPSGQVWLRTTKIPIRDAVGNTCSILGIHEDITDYKRVDLERERLLNEIQQSHNLLRFVVDATPDWIFIKDKECRYSLVNQGYANALHIAPDDFIGKNDLDLGFPEEQVKGNAAKGIRGFWADDQLVMTSEQMQIFADDPVTVDGVVHTFHTIKTPLKNTSGSVWGLLSFSRDITEIKQANEQMKMLSYAVENSKDSIQLLDENLRFVYVNKQYCVDLGYTKEELLNMSIYDVDPEGAVKTMNWREEFAGQNNQSFTIKVTHKGKNGELIPFEVSASQIEIGGEKHILTICRNLSEIWKYQQQLEMVNDALDRIDTAVFINDAEGRFVYVNQKACQSLQYSRDELLTMTLPTVDLIQAANADNQLISELELGRSLQVFLRSSQMSKNGRAFPVEVKGTIYTYLDKSFGVSLVRDLSGANEIDDILIQAEQDFTILVENSPDIIIRYDKNYRCIYVNQAWTKITGYSQFDMLDNTLKQNIYLPLEETSKLEGIFKQVIQTKQAQTQEFVLPHSVTNQPVYLLIDIVPECNFNGQVIGILVVARDVSSMKKYQEELRDKQIILEEAQRLGHSGSWALDMVSNKREWSKETYNIFEIDMGKSTPSYDTFIGLVHPEDREKIDKIYVERGRTLNDYEVNFRLLFPDGRIKFVIERGITQFDKNERPFRYLGTITDITTQKEKELELILMKEKAEESSRIKSTFLALMSHETRTPLNVILGFSSLLKDDSLTPEERKEFIEYIDNGSWKLSKLMDNVIELSKLLSGDVHVDAKIYSPRDIVIQLYLETNEICYKKGKEELHLKMEMAEDLDQVNFVSDPEKINTAVRILADNALKFTPSGEITFGVKLVSSKQVSFYVSDTGIGIPEEKHRVIFEPFVQNDNAFSRKFEGLGIGLSLAYQIAKVLGGEITLVSETSKGSVFSFTIPIEYKQLRAIGY